MEAGLSFSQVENPNLREFVRRVREDKTFQLPSRQTFAKAWLDGAHQRVMDFLVHKFEKCVSFAATTDGWSNFSLQHFCSLTLHGITSDFRLVSSVIACEPIFRYHTDDGVHSAKSIANLLQSTFKSCGLDIQRLAALVTDNGGAAPHIASNLPVEGVSKIV